MVAQGSLYAPLEMSVVLWLPTTRSPKDASGVGPAGIWLGLSFVGAWRLVTPEAQADGPSILCPTLLSPSRRPRRHQGVAHGATLPGSKDARRFPCGLLGRSCGSPCARTPSEDDHGVAFTSALLPAGVAASLSERTGAPRPSPLSDASESSIPSLRDACPARASTRFTRDMERVTRALAVIRRSTTPRSSTRRPTRTVAPTVCISPARRCGTRKCGANRLPRTRRSPESGHAGRRKRADTFVTAPTCCAGKLRAPAMRRSKRSAGTRRKHSAEHSADRGERV